MKMDALVAAAIAALAAIFVAALIALLFICRRQHKQKNWDRLDKCSAKHKRNKCPQPDLAMALGDMGLGSALEQVMNDQQWVDDVSGLIPHCLTILRICHSLTERLANLVMCPDIKNFANRMIEAARRIPSRVDDVVRAMYPPLDPHLLEARAAALVLAVGQLAIIAQSAIGSNKCNIDASLQEMDKHLMVLREAVQEIDMPKKVEPFKHNSYV